MRNVHVGIVKAPVFAEPVGLRPGDEPPRAVDAREVELVQITVPKPLAHSMATAVMRHADGQADGEVRLDHPDVGPDELMRVGHLIQTFATPGLR